jgi:hypothetical protein
LVIVYWYEYFEQVSDEEVAELIERSRGAKVGETHDSYTERDDIGKIMERETEHRS